jgi:predicted outer membrane protein
MKSIHLILLIGLAVLLLAAAPVGQAVDKPALQPSVVVKVSDGGFHWGDAAVGAAAAIAMALLVLGLVLTFRHTERRKL